MTQGGLRVSAERRPPVYPKGVKVTRGQMKGIHLLRHEVCPKWNYSIVPSDLWE